MLGRVATWRTIEALPAKYGRMPNQLHPRIGRLLEDRGIKRLYTHQSLAIRHVLDGRHVVVVTPTASGKTLCFNLPVLDSLIREPDSRALYLFPTKALGHDQLDELRSFMRGLCLEGSADAYDGDTPRSRRPRVRDSASVILSNPDMLHVGILPNHVRWRDFFQRLSYVVIDEMHIYRGIFGSHVANVIRRMSRICRFYGSDPQFILCSATIANPRRLAQRLIERPVSVISESGAPRGPRHMVFLNPPVVDQSLGLRRPLVDEVRDLANHLLTHNVQTVIFCRSRTFVEHLVLALRAAARLDSRDPGAIRGYRSGYLPAERREIEKGLRDGSVRAVAATNALELGVDIGGLDACIMAGYPGTIASTWQQAGRAGRGPEASAAFLVASPSPLDQYMISHPRYFFGRSHEHALINPDNLHLLFNHIGCAAFELPLRDDETFGKENLPEFLEAMAEMGTVRHVRRKWHWTGGDRTPAGEISLRTAEGGSVSIVSQDARGSVTTIGRVERHGAPIWLYEGAIYLHEGQTYLVTAVDWDAGVARVESVSTDHITQSSGSTRIDIERILEETHEPNAGVSLGEVTITSKTTGYRRLRIGTMEHLGWGEADCPEQQIYSASCWLTVPDEVVIRLAEEGWWVGEHPGAPRGLRGPNWAQQRDRARRRDGFCCSTCNAPERPGHRHHVHHVVPFRDFGWERGKNDRYLEANRLANLVTLCPRCHRQAEQQVAVQSTLSGLARVCGHVIPVLLMCDSRDVGIQADVKAPQTKLPTIFVFDRIPAGVGLCDEVYAQYREILDKAAELVRDCPCASGCPSCLGAASVDNPRAKEQVLRLVQALSP